MLLHAKFLKIFWGEVVRIAADITNLSLTYALKMDVQERMWTGKNVSYKHVKIFECRAFTHIPTNERSKFDCKVRLCIYLRNSQEQFSYRL